MEVGGNRWLYHVCCTLYMYTYTYIYGDDHRYIQQYTHAKTNFLAGNYIGLFSEINLLQVTKQNIWDY